MSKVHTTEEFIKEEDLYRTGELTLAMASRRQARQNNRRTN